ncbi:MAG TPA: Crp/Fnr family transcriptional regulator [Bacteroidales bacterium]|nr:Crp/Fnr family transcriptional regulator [Bacteroidales bacterium]
MQYPNPYIEKCLEGFSSIFKGLNQKDKETITQHHTLATIKKGGYIFKEGEKPRGLICLATGKVKVFKEGVGGRRQILKMVRQKGFIGYHNIYSDRAWSVSAIAVEDSTVCIFDKGSLIKILKKNADLGLKFIKIISEELWFSNNRTVSLTQKHIRGRLAESLLMLRDTYGYEEDGKTIQVSLSREDIANLSNMTTSNGIRTLSNLASEGIIEMAGRKIRILESTNLEHISDLG